MGLLLASVLARKEKKLKISIGLARPGQGKKYWLGKDLSNV